MIQTDNDMYQISNLTPVKNVHVIGLAGPMGCGKSTIATMMVNALPRDKHTAYIISFADALKDLARSLGWNGEKDEKGRKLLQLLGTDICRNCIDINYVVWRWYEKIRNYFPVYQVSYCEKRLVIIADDVRFDNEANAILNLGGHIFSVRGRGHYSEDHPSEHGLTLTQNIDYIQNNGTYADLKKTVKRLIGDLFS